MVHGRKKKKGEGGGAQCILTSLSRGRAQRSLWWQPDQSAGQHRAESFQQHKIWQIQHRFSHHLYSVTSISFTHWKSSTLKTRRSLRRFFPAVRAHQTPRMIHCWKIGLLPLSLHCWNIFEADNAKQIFFVISLKLIYTSVNTHLALAFISTFPGPVEAGRREEFRSQLAFTGVSICSYPSCSICTGHLVSAFSFEMTLTWPGGAVECGSKQFTFESSTLCNFRPNCHFKETQASKQTVILKRVSSSLGIASILILFISTKSAL